MLNFRKLLSLMSHKYVSPKEYPNKQIVASEAYSDNFSTPGILQLISLTKRGPKFSICSQKTEGQVFGALRAPHAAPTRA